MSFPPAAAIQSLQSISLSMQRQHVHQKVDRTKILLIQRIALDDFFTFYSRPVLLEFL